MTKAPLTPAEAQPIGSREFHPSLPHDVAPPEPSRRSGSDTSAAVPNTLQQGGGDGRAEDLLKVRALADEVGGVERLRELCDLLQRLQG